ncbi:hypothetical protein AAF712_008897 [Marasmius tenuissimus]|uniref:Uncharacterized protein n=1 Tax=Marasmius tenuissimus TaxID=585030 RepID=A0ABR2ZSC1_9AGAR
MLRGLAILAASLSVCSATKLLSVSTSAPASSDDVTGLEVVTTVTNTGDETLKLLNNPMSVLSKWATNSFEVYNGDGVTAKFNGLFVRYSPELAAKSNNASEFIVLTPGASFKVAHEVGNFYNFTNAGPGSFTFKPSNVFQAVELDGSLTVIEANVDSANTELTGQLASSHFVSLASAGGATLGTPSGLQKRATYRSNCSQGRRTVNDEAIAAADVLSRNAVIHLNGNPSGSTLQTTWYGTFDQNRYDLIKRTFSVSNMVFRSN